MNDAFAKVLDRAVVVLEEENKALRERRTSRLAEMHAQKSVILFELERLATESGPIDEPASARLRELRARLVENQAILRLNIEALREMVETLQELGQHEESDGTYSIQAIVGAKAR